MLTKVVELAIVPPYGIQGALQQTGRGGTHALLEAGAKRRARQVRAHARPKCFARAFLEFGSPDLAPTDSTCRPSGCAASVSRRRTFFPQARREQNFRGGETGKSYPQRTPVPRQVRPTRAGSRPFRPW